MRASVCVGDYAKTPYYITGIELPVYCMEELCYCLKENAFLLDASLMEDALADWIDRECHLKELARSLHGMIHKVGVFSTFVVSILEYVGLYDADTVNEVEQALKRGAGLSNLEKRKSQVDFLVQKKKFALALNGYETLLAQCQDAAGQTRFKANLLHNKGVALTGMMLYRQAASAFLEAYEAEGDTEDYQAYLAAKRMELPEEEYIALTADKSGNYEISLGLEKLLDELNADWKEQPMYHRLEERALWRLGGDKQKYYDENERITQKLKDNYRYSAQAEQTFIGKQTS